MKKETIDSVVSLAAFSLLEQRLPKNMPEPLKLFLGHVSDALHTKKPRSVAAAIALPTTRNGWQVDQVDLLVLGSFRNYYGVIKSLARLLSPLLLQHQILPKIHPFTLHDIQMCNSDPSFLKRMKESGTVVFHRSQHERS